MADTPDDETDPDADLEPWPPDFIRYRLMHLAFLSGQSFLDLLVMHPRDWDTLELILRQRTRAAEEAAEEAAAQERFAAMRAQVNANR